MKIEQANTLEERAPRTSEMLSQPPVRPATSLWKYLFLTILVVAPTFIVYQCTKTAGNVVTETMKIPGKVLDNLKELSKAVDRFFSTKITITVDSPNGSTIKEVSQMVLWCDEFDVKSKWAEDSTFGSKSIELKVDFTANYGVEVGDLLKGAMYNFEEKQWVLNPLPLKLLSLHIRHQDVVEDENSIFSKPVSATKTATEFNRIRYKTIPDLEKKLKDDPRNKEFAERRIRNMFEGLNLKVRFKTDEEVQTIPGLK